MPVEPEPTSWMFPEPSDSDPSELIAIGADLAPGTVLSAYRTGYFPMPIERGGPMGWWSPDPRAVLLPASAHVSRSLARSMRRFEFRVNTAFEAVIDGCADPRRPHGWIDPAIRTAYLELHELGWVHSVETWLDDRLVGGLYGVAIGGLFAAESKFHTATDASKAAVVTLASLCNDNTGRVIDVQWQSDHLQTLGVLECSRDSYRAALPSVLANHNVSVFDGKPHTICPSSPA